MYPRTLSTTTAFLLAAALLLQPFVTGAADQTIEGDLYRIHVQADGAKAVITVTPKTVEGVGHYCNPEFPWKLVITDQDGVTTDRKQYDAPFKKPDGTVNAPAHTVAFGKPKVVFEVAYSAAPGKKVQAKLTFGICDPKQCYRKTQKLEW